MTELMRIVALKEWAATCAALEAGRQIVLLRKGGIAERRGRFELQHASFVLFPTLLHQSADQLKPNAHRWLTIGPADPSHIEIRLLADVSEVLTIARRAQLDAIEHEHIFSRRLIDMRLAYKPERPLYLIVVRVSRLAKPVMVVNTAAYAGCRSWVPLTEPVGTNGARPILSESDFEARRSAIKAAVAGA